MNTLIGRISKETSRHKIWISFHCYVGTGETVMIPIDQANYLHMDNVPFPPNELESKSIGFPDLHNIS